MFSIVVSHYNIVTAKKSSSSNNKSLQQIASNSIDFHLMKMLQPSKQHSLNQAKIYYGHIKGELKNIGSDAISFVKVTDHFYDKSVNIVDIKDMYLTSITI